MQHRFANKESAILSIRIRNALRSALRADTVSDVNEAIILLGCSRTYFRRYIARKFTDGMTWKNWGINGWHLDHIRPLASFDLTDTSQLSEAFHYSNYQPLWASANYVKKAHF